MKTEVLSIMDFESIDFLIVGCGFLGSVLAERLANDLNQRVLIIDKRNHIGGNCYSEIEPITGIEYHKYGTHIFHTSNQKVWQYINKFTDFNSYFHQVLTTYHDKVYQMPINLETINSFYGINLKPYEVDGFLAKEISKEINIDKNNFEGKAISLIGRQLYEAFIKGYTLKQWQKEPSELPASLLSRLPFRKNYNESYYFSRWQGIPLNGYKNIFEKLLKSPKIQVKLNLDYFDIRHLIHQNTKIVYSGALDKFFDYKFGPLEWRSLKFDLEIKNVMDFQGTSVMNYAAHDIPFTRIHEPKHLHPEREFNEKNTLIVKEYPLIDSKMEPFYPVNDEKNQKIVLQYKELAILDPDLYIAGRLGDYKYLDMHETIDSALNIYENIKNKYYEK